MTARYRDASNALKITGVVRFRDASNALKIAGVVRARDASNSLKIMFAPGDLVEMVPPSAFKSGSPQAGTQAFNAVSNVGTPSAYVWSIISGNGTVQSGQGTATATIRAVNDTVEFQCVMTIGSQQFTAYGTFTYAKI